MVASDTRGPPFKSNHWRKFIMKTCTVNCWKDNKRKRGRESPIFIWKRKPCVVQLIILLHQTSPKSSVTNLAKFCHFGRCLWQNATHTLANLWHYWSNFHCCKWPNIEKNPTIWSHYKLLTMNGNGWNEDKSSRRHTHIVCRSDWSFCAAQNFF